MQQTPGGPSYQTPASRARGPPGSALRAGGRGAGSAQPTPLTRPELGHFTGNAYVGFRPPPSAQVRARRCTAPSNGGAAGGNFTQPSCAG